VICPYFPQQRPVARWTSKSRKTDPVPGEGLFDGVGKALDIGFAASGEIDFRASGRAGIALLREIGVYCYFIQYRLPRSNPDGQSLPCTAATRSLMAPRWALPQALNL